MANYSKHRNFTVKAYIVGNSCKWKRLITDRGHSWKRLFLKPCLSRSLKRCHVVSRQIEQRKHNVKWERKRSRKELETTSKAQFATLPLVNSVLRSAHAVEDYEIRKTDKHAIAHEQRHVTAYFSRVILGLRWVVQLFRVASTTENILLTFCRFAYPRISFFSCKSLQSNSLELEGSKICNLCLFSAQIYA